MDNTECVPTMDQALSAEGQSETLTVAIVGLGVSSIQLVRQLQREGVNYRVFTLRAFGVWGLLYEAGEDFDLVTTTESTNFHDWGWDYQFPFFTAKEYYEKLCSLVTPEIEDRVMYTKVGKASWSTATGKWQLLAADGSTLAYCEHLVSSIGFEPDGSIIENMKRSMSVCDSTVLVKGFSDTANLYISRLMLNNNRVVLASDHFTTFDKVADIGATNEDGSKYWMPFDQGEPFHHLSQHPELWSDRVLWLQFIPPFFGSTLLGRLWRWRVGLDALLGSCRFDRSRPGNSTFSLLWRKAVPAGMFLPVKYWPVDAFFDFYKTHEKHMLDSNILMNDIYFFLKLGLVRLFSRAEVVERGDGLYALPDGTTFKPDLVLESTRARRRMLPIEIDGQPLVYRYSDYLYGIWNTATPNLYLLGGTRPTTGAFGSMGEMTGLFAHELMLNPEVRDRVSRDFETLAGEWHEQSLGGPRTCPDIQETDWAGQHCERIAKLIGVNLTLRVAMKAGLLDAYCAGANNMLRYTITGPFAVPGAADKYRKQCNREVLGDAARIKWELIFPHMVAFNLLLLYAMWQPEHAATAMASFGALLWLSSNFRAAYMQLVHAFNVFVMPTVSYAGNYHVLRIVFPLVVLLNALRVHVATGAVVAAAVSPLFWGGVALPAPISTIYLAALTLTSCSALYLWGVLDTFMTTGIAPTIIAVALEAGFMLVFSKRMIFNDPRGKEKFQAHFERYLTDHRKKAAILAATSPTKRYRRYTKEEMVAAGPTINVSSTPLPRVRRSSKESVWSMSYGVAS